MFLFGTIPGPQEPSLEQMNELLKPLVYQFQELWSGIFFTSTPKHPGGRIIHAALWPLIADLPAIRKVAGLASHSSKNFCSHCALKKNNQQETDITQWPSRINHRQHAEMWRDAKTQHEQDNIFNEFGVRYTVLSELAYWRPLEFMTIDVMHCLLLGLLHDHAGSFLRIRNAGAEVTLKQKSAAKHTLPEASETLNVRGFDPDSSFL